MYLSKTNSIMVHCGCTRLWCGFTQEEIDAQEEQNERNHKHFPKKCFDCHALTGCPFMTLCAKCTAKVENEALFEELVETTNFLIVGSNSLLNGDFFWRKAMKDAKLSV
jgi:hypothetical protein